jgi:hypothetical protein
MAAPTILAHGSPEQKKRFLRPLWSGRRSGASCSVSLVPADHHRGVLSQAIDLTIEGELSS